MNSPTIGFHKILFAALVASFLFLCQAHAVNVINITGFWQDDNGHFIEIERNGPNAIAVMRSDRGRQYWMRGTMDLGGGDIYFVKKRGSRVVGTVRGDLTRGFGPSRIRWNSGAVWRRSSLSAFDASLREQDHDHLHGPDPHHSLNGRWQSSDRTLIDIRQEGQSLSFRVVSGQNRWTSGRGKLAASNLSLDCYHGSSHRQSLTGRYRQGSSGKLEIVWSNGQTWYQRSDDFRVITDPIGQVINVPGALIDTAIPSRPTSFWVFQSGGGYFHRGADGNWHEHGPSGVQPHRYEETGRTAVKVTLYYRARRTFVTLERNRCTVRHAGRAIVYAGHWSSYEPGANRPARHRKGPGHGNASCSGPVHPTPKPTLRIGVDIERFLGGFLTR